MRINAVAARTRRLYLPVAFSLLEALVVLALSSGVLLALAVSHSRSFFLVSKTRLQVEELRKNNWRAEQLSGASCVADASSVEKPLLHCKNPHVPTPYSSKTFALEPTP